MPRLRRNETNSDSCNGWVFIGPLPSHEVLDLWLLGFGHVCVALPPLIL